MRVSPIIGRVGGLSSGQQLYTANGTFVVPAGVTSICVVAIGGGGPRSYDGTDYSGGGGGGLAYANAIAVTPGESLEVTVTATDPSLSPQGLSQLRRVATSTSLVAASAGRVAGGNVIAGTGFAGGLGAQYFFGPSYQGGGAGGYTSAGGAGDPNGLTRGGGGADPLGGGPGAAGGASSNQNGLSYGGGAAATIGTPGLGCVRIIWGAGRAFPNTNTGDV